MNPPIWFCLTLTLALTACSRDESADSSGNARPPSQVVAIPASRQSVEERLSLVGTMAANEQVELKSETDGTVEQINFHEGQKVEKGRMLVRLEESKLASSLAQAEANFALSKSNHDRARDLLNDKLISQSEFDQTAASFAANDAAVQLRERLLADTKIFAPFEGVMGARMISPGQVITRNTSLTWLVDLDPLKVEVNVPERFLSQVLPGQKVELAVAAWPDRNFTGEVFFISPYVDPQTRTALIKATVPNPGHLLKPGMFAGLDLTLQVRSNAIVVPEAAINQVLEGDRANLMLVGANNTAEVRLVKVGLRIEGGVEIVDGLVEGEMVIVEGFQKIGPGMPVVLAPEESTKPYLPKVLDPLDKS
jgi:membrane fusion protein (multidrug efflux system)